jgi:ATP-dependent Lon protease
MADLYHDLPNFTSVLDDVKRSVALSKDTSDNLTINPILLLGPPGIGKTHFAKKLSELLETGMGFVSMASLTAGWLLSGSSSQWRGSRPGKVFETLVDGEYANPVMVVDEIDKVGTNTQYDPLGSLYSLLEHDTAKSFTDEFAEIPIDTSQVIWVITANDARSIPDPILSRLTVFEIEAPNRDQARVIAKNLYKEIRCNHDWGGRFGVDMSEETLETLSVITPRVMRRALMTGFGNACLDKRSEILPEDLPREENRRTSIGFTR